MKRTILITAALIFLGMIANANNPRDIAEKASNSIGFTSMEMSSTLKIFDNKGNVRERQVAVATKKFGDTYKTMIRFLAPADVKGTSMLIFDYEEKGDDMWIYMPSMRKTRRIVSSEKGRSFMGSEFTNANMSKPNFDDFNYSTIGTETIDGKEFWKIESICKTESIADEYGYSKQVAYIEKLSYLTHKVEYYDRYNELQKIMTISDFRKQSNGVYFAYYMEMNNVQNGRKSVMTVNLFQLGSSLKETDFSTTSLEKM
ncbi:MAG: outer membrane lipoprotein-sorting protein [Bacteroidetes bacterium]|nr:outer membrane lipoprotein-sorting protein [Bacteroidota bacterium]